MAGAADTPMMRQYLQIKAEVPDALLLYRMGDFYELFFQDAVVAAEALELTLTSRNKGDPDPIPMAGVPYHALEGYLRRLVEAGHKVALAEQRAPKEGAKLMERELVRVVTPGVPWDPDTVEAREACWLAGAHQAARGGPVGLAFLDVSTGRLRLTEVDDLDTAAGELLRMEPRELVLAATLASAPALAEALAHRSVTSPEPTWFDIDAGDRALRQQLQTADLVGFGAGELGPALGAAGALLSYCRDTARVGLDNLHRIEPYRIDGHMALDEATRRNLELTRPLRGTGRKGTLLHLLDRTCTPLGGRLLRDWISRPLIDVSRIRARQDAVQALLDGPLRHLVRAHLKRVADLERLGTKCAQATANARDLVSLAVSLRALPDVLDHLEPLAAFQDRLPDDRVLDLADDIDAWLVDEPPASLTEGGLIRRGAHADLDEITTLAREGKGAIARMEARERQQTGIPSLKVKHNKVFGYFLEVTNANLHKVPDAWHRKQTLAGCERYITPELKEFEEKVLGADERRKELEYALFRELRDRAAAQVARLQRLADAVAFIDCVAALAEVAVDRRYVRPDVDASSELEIRGGRHPVVEAMSLDERFVPNDLRLDGNRRLVILTGPNMAGKSTVMRQVALIALLAQVGSFVPADEARLGVADRIFVRVGASDDLSSGRSTFMVEMSETALILNQATSRSLLFLDEIGRGTSTYDGLAIAWAVAEAVHDRVRARAIFATHYHELVALADDKERVVNLHVSVSEWADKVVFLRTLREGGVSRSYGIQCARLAGMPEAVVGRARELLAELEARPRHGPPTRQLGLFQGDPPASAPPLAAAPPHPVVAQLRELDPNNLTPRQALDLLFSLKETARPPG